MCISDDCINVEITSEGIERRAFLTSATAAIVGVALASDAVGQQTPQPPSNALNDPNIVQGMVSFKSGSSIIQGYQARPKAKGKYRAVLVLHGSFGLTEDHRFTAAQLAQNGFASLAIKRFSRYPNLTQVDLNQSDRTDRHYLSRAFNEEEIQDAQAAINYLKSLSFVKGGRVAIVGFCGGGYQALWLSTRSKDIKTVVAFYAPPVMSEQFQLKTDPKPNLMDMVKQMKVPIQGHYGAADPIIPVEDVKKFEQALKLQNKTVEIFVYEGAGHAFCDYTRSNLYRPDAAALAKNRTFEFLKKHLK